MTTFPRNNPNGYFWWIDTFTIRHGHAFPFRIQGENDLRATDDPDRFYAWSVPNLKGGGGRYAFRLRLVQAP